MNNRKKRNEGNLLRSLSTKRKKKKIINQQEDLHIAAKSKIHTNHQKVFHKLTIEKVKDSIITAKQNVTLMALHTTIKIVNH